MSRERLVSSMEGSTTSDGNTTSNFTYDESCSIMRRLLEDIGGKENLSQFMALLQKYTEHSELQILESQQFNEAISHTAFSFSYAYQDRHLFGKFLELSPLYVAAPWFVQQYTLKKRYRQSVSLAEILYVWACCWRVIRSLTNPTCNRENSKNDGTVGSTILTLGSTKVSVPLLSDIDKVIIIQFDMYDRVLTDIQLVWKSVVGILLYILE